MSNSFVTLARAVACQAPLSMGFPRQEHWSGLPFPSLEDLPDPGIEPMSPALTGRFLTMELLGKPNRLCIYREKYTYFKQFAYVIMETR